MALNKVEICGVNTSDLPVLKPEEKEELFRRIKAGDKEARERYIKGNLRLVLSIIRRFQNSNENADDLFQIGCIGPVSYTHLGFCAFGNHSGNWRLCRRGCRTVCICIIFYPSVLCMDPDCSICSLLCDFEILSSG